MPGVGYTWTHPPLLLEQLVHELRFMETLKANTDNWDASFSDAWTTADLVDCILSYTATELVKKFSKPNSEEAKAMQEALRTDAKASRQFLLLVRLGGGGAVTGPVRALRRRTWANTGGKLVQHGTDQLGTPSTHHCLVRPRNLSALESCWIRVQSRHTAGYDRHHTRGSSPPLAPLRVRPTCTPAPTLPHSSTCGPRWCGRASRPWR